MESDCHTADDAQPEHDDEPFCPDLTVAQCTPLCILISASRDVAWGTARKIARGCGSGLSWIDCDTAEPDEMADLLRQHVPVKASGSPDRILFLREVQALTPESQTLLNELITLERATWTRPRLIASSSLSLYERVRAGRFDEALFYKLNAVHITL